MNKHFKKEACFVLLIYEMSALIFPPMVQQLPVDQILLIM